jgi:hypothetical protein
MSHKTFGIFSLTVAVLFLTSQAAPAQSTTGTPTTPSGPTTPTTGGGGSLTTNSINYSSGFNSLSPVPTSQVSPTNSVALSPTSSVGGNTSNRTGTPGSTTGTNMPVPTTYNPWGAYYQNLYSPGLGSSLTGTQGQGGRTTNTGGAFGQPLYSLVSTTPTTTTSTATTQTTQGLGFTTIGMNKAPSYVTALSEDLIVRPPSDTRLQNELRTILNRSSALKGQGAIQLIVKDSQVILKGQVNRDQQRRLAEGLVRMTPGVRDVLNELTVVSAKK